MEESGVEDIADTLAIIGMVVAIVISIIIYIIFIADGIKKRQNKINIFLLQKQCNDFPRKI